MALKNIKRIKQAKVDIKAAIEDKGVAVPDTALISDYDDYIAKIETGGSSGLSQFGCDGHVDEEGLKAIGWDDDDIDYLQSQCWWDEKDDDIWLINDTEKALYASGFSIDTSQTASAKAYHNINVRFLPLLTKYKTKNLTSIRNAFYGCCWLYAIPKMNFSGITALSNYRNAFCYTNNLHSWDSSTHNDLFDYANMLNQNWQLRKLRLDSISSISVGGNVSFGGSVKLDLRGKYINMPYPITCGDMDWRGCSLGSTMAGETFRYSSNCQQWLIDDVDFSKVTSMWGTNGDNALYVRRLVADPTASAFKGLTCTLYFTVINNLLEHDSCVAIFRGVADLLAQNEDGTYVVGGGTEPVTRYLYLGSGNYGRCTADELAIATDKGWILG